MQDRTEKPDLELMSTPEKGYMYKALSPIPLLEQVQPSAFWSVKIERKL